MACVNRKHNAEVFEFVETEYTMSSGRPRPSDITIVPRGNQKWVEVRDRPRGVSTFDAKGVPEGKDWSYYRIPAGTVLPPGLCVVRDQFNARCNATHYTLAPAHDMPLSLFKSLLSKLAAAVVKEVG